MIPNYTKESIDRYVKHKIPTGSFLYSVLTNDLFEAVGRADENNMPALFDICDYIYNHTPSTCHGSKKIVANWLGKA